VDLFDRQSVWHNSQSFASRLLSKQRHQPVPRLIDIRVTTDEILLRRATCAGGRDACLHYIQQRLNPETKHLGIYLLEGDGARLNWSIRSPMPLKRAEGRAERPHLRYNLCHGDLFYIQQQPEFDSSSQAKLLSNSRTGSRVTANERANSRAVKSTRLS